MFAKYPVPGTTKTRLAQSIGDESAARLSGAFTRDLIQRFRNIADRFVLAATPRSKNAADWFQMQLQGQGEVNFQPEGSLGDRIAWFFETQFEAGADRIVLIGSDSPDLPMTIVQDAFRQLESTAAVVAPSDDGGFVLLGLSCFSNPGDVSDALRQVSWSTETTCAETCQALEDAGAPPTLLATWHDVDTIDDLQALSARLDSAAGAQHAACDVPATIAELKKLDIWRASG
jgi:uncharacterized protein